MTSRFETGDLTKHFDERKNLKDKIIRDATSGIRKRVTVSDPEGDLVGPFAAMAIAPLIGAVVNDLGVALRTNASLAPALREYAILVIAEHYSSEFEWAAHVPSARSAGIPDSHIENLANRTVPFRLDQDESAVINTVKSLLTNHSLSATQYKQVAAAIGPEQVAEIVWLWGYYSMLAGALKTFGLDRYPDRQE